MKRRLFLNVLGVIALTVNLLPVSVMAAPQDAPGSVSSQPVEALSSLGTVLPSWFTANSSSDSARLASVGNVLPGWFTGLYEPPASPVRVPEFKPMNTPIAEALLSVNVSGPSVASLGAPPTFGEVYTAVIRNTGASQIAYNAFFTATHQPYFIYDGWSQILSGTQPITFALSNSATGITWTPGVTVNLAPSQAITLSFRLRADCAAQSGQQMRVGVRYNADPPPASPMELNTGGLNITTGRGNLVIKKEPSLQALGTPDFGKPITWIVTVQNTGLGILYGGVITDTGGVNLSQPSGNLNPTATISSLGINQEVTYTVVGRVEACNFTNVAQGAWTCGNLVGDATWSKPVSSTASVLFTPMIPRITVQATSPVTFPYCSPLTRTIALTISNSGGPAANFRLDSNLEGNAFLDIITSSLGSSWQYNASTGVFAYASGSPTGTIPAQGAGAPVTLTFQVRPRANICAAGSGDILFEPLYNDVCSGDPFTGNPVHVTYQYAQGQSPEVAIDKSGPSAVDSGQVFPYQVQVQVQNPINISGPVVVSDVLPFEFVLAGPITASAGVVLTNGQNLSWVFTPTAAYGVFTQTLTYWVRAVSTRTLCGASQVVHNDARVRAVPTCPGCSILADDDRVDTAIGNNEGIDISRWYGGSSEACGLSGLTFSNRYVVSGSTVITWTGAAFTDSMGINLGDGALPPGAPPLIYVAGSLRVVIGGTDYTTFLTPTIDGVGHLVLDLTPLQAAGALTQNLTLMITYTAAITEGTLMGTNHIHFLDWSQLYLPSLSAATACATNDSFNQSLDVMLSRADMGVGVQPAILDRCRTNRVTINVHRVQQAADGHPLLPTLADHVVVTYTSSVTEILTARNFSFGGSLAFITPTSIVTDTTMGGGRGIITFTLPAAADVPSDGTIQFDVDVNCKDSADWTAGLAFQSLCAIPYGRAATRDHVYRVPDLTLFTTPIEYTVREKDVLWKFFVANNGNLTATNVVITNALSGVAVTSYSTNSGAGVISLDGTPPITAPTPAVFTISEIAPGEQREVTVTARVFLCTPLMVTITAQLDCFGSTCKQLQGVVKFNTPDPYLLTNNGQTADLPMCDLGDIVFRTKNASSDVTLYQLDITETLLSLMPDYTQPFTLSIVDRNGSVITTTTAFTPEIAFSTTAETRLAWRAASAPGGIFDSLDPLAVVVITVPVRTSCVPPDSPQSFASALAFGPCGKELGYTENAVTLQTAKPSMSVLKQGKGPTGDYDKTVYALPGDIVTWRLRVRNEPVDRAYVAHNVVLSDAWPANFNLITFTTAYSPVVAGGTLGWTIGDVEVNDEMYFYITGTLSNVSCAALTTNTTQLTFGCASGCASSLVPIDTANVDSQPNLQVILSPSSVSLCGGDIPVTVRNLGATAYSNTLTIQLPSGFVYSETVGASLTPSATNPSTNAPQFLWNTIPGRVTPSPYYELTLTLRIRNSAPSGSCPVESGSPVTATLTYDNYPTCSDGGPYTATHNVNLNVLAPTLQILKSPRTQTVDAGQRVTWTIRLTNTGTGIAQNLVITDVAGSNYTSLTATVGTGGSAPTVVGNTITWTTPSLAAGGGVWTATVSALLLPAGDNRNIVMARARCATACETAVVSDTAYTTLLQQFAKYPAIQTGTIGSLVVFTFTSSLPDADALYEQLTITDALPVGLGFVDGFVTYDSDGDGSLGGPFLGGPDSPASAPGLYGSGNVVWNLGDLTGTVQIFGIITAVIQNVDSNYDGLRLTNILLMTYTDDGQPYIYTSTSPVDVLEPILHIGKSYFTPYGCNATLAISNFNSGTLAGWTPTAGTFTIASGAALQTSNNTADAILYRNANANPNDYSYSAMVWSGDATSSVGMVFRYQDNTNYYRLILRLNDGGTNINLQEVGGATPITQTATFIPVPNRWYHLEVQMEGNRICGYVDGVRYFDVTDASPRTGVNVGLYANNCAANACRFDDVLVTRLNQSACLVGANDLVTYTLTISNQARLTGYDLVITDSLPGGMSLITYMMQSDDPASSVAAAPSPIPGATGVLTWGISQLRATSPFTSLAHQALTLTVVLQVSPAITANTVLSNQASLAYDNWTGSTSPTTITRQYSGGSHSTAVRTLNSGLSKTVTFSPPPTATLGSLVTYTLIIPSPIISATMYNVGITDTINPSMTVEAVTTAGGVGASSGWSGRTVTATFASVPSYTRAYVTVTTRISSAFGAYAGYAITNSAVMTHATGGLTSTLPVTTIVGEPRLVLVKSSQPPTSNTVGANQSVTYTVRITNSSAITSSPAYDVVLTDTLPVDMRNTPPTVITVTRNGAPVDASLFVTGYVPATGVFTVVFTNTFAFSLPVGNVLVITYVATVNSDVGAGLNLINGARAGWSSLPGDWPGDRSYNTPTSTTNVHTALPPIVKSVAPLTATLGSIVTFTILLPQPSITAAVYNAVVTDRLDSRAMLLTVDNSAGAPVTRTGNVFTVAFGTIPAGEQRSITVTAVLSSPQGAVAGNVITNVAALSHTSGITSSNRPVFTVTEPSLTLVKASSPPTSNTVSAGDRITYTVAVTNRASITTSAAYDVAFTDTSPIGLRNTLPQIMAVTLDGAPVPSSDYATAYNAGVLTVTFAPTMPIPVGSVLMIQYVAIVDGDVLAAIDLPNLAQVTWSSLGGAVPGDRNYNPVTGTTTLHTPFVTALGKAVAPPTATIGSQVVFTISAPDAPIGAMLYNVVVTDVVDGRLQIIEASLPAAFSGQLVTATYAVIPTYTQQIMVVTATVRDLVTVTNDTLITNIASMNYGNNPTGTIWSPVVTTTVHEPVVPLTKSVQTPRAPDGAGDIVTYTLALSNTGEWPAFDVVVTDALPTGIDFLATQAIAVTDPPTATTSSYYPVWNVSQLNVGGYIYITFTARVSDAIGAGLTLTNSAWGQYDNQFGYQAGQRTYPILTDTAPISTGLPELALVKAVAPSPVQADALLTYTLSVTNTGIVSATGVVITDAVPANTSYQSCGPTLCGEAAGVVSWTLGTLDVGVPRVVTLTVQVNSPLLTGTLIANTAWVTSTQGATRTDTITTPVHSAHTLGIVKTATPLPVQAGDWVTYTLAWSVGGNEPALNVTISDVTPMSTTFAAAIPPATSDPGVGGTGPVIWALGDQNPPASGVVTLVVQVNSPMLSGTQIYNGVVITDSQGVTRTDAITTPVNSSHALIVSKSAFYNPVAAGDLQTYTIAYTVAGNEPALNVTISDVTPVSTTFVVAIPPATSDPGAGGSGPVLWSLGALDPPTSGIVTLVVRVDPVLLTGTLIANSVLITDSQGVTRTDTITTPVGSAHTLNVLKSAMSDPVAAGDLQTYTIAYAVAGNEPALNVTISDVTPVSTTFVVAIPPATSDPGVGGSGPVIWSLGTLNPFALGVVTLVVRVDASLLSGTLIANSVIITDSQGVTNTNIITTPVRTAADLAVWKADNPDPVIVGTFLTYTVMVVNNGPSNAQDVVVSDTLPSEVTFVTATTPVTVTLPDLAWPLGTMASGESRYLTITVRVNPSAMQTFTNTVAVTSTTPESNTTNNRHDEPTTPLVPGLELVKSVTPGEVVRGMFFTYTIRITNTGQMTFTTLSLTDTLPPEFHYVGGTGAPMDPDVIAEPSLVWINLGSLNPGASIAVSFGVTATQGITGTYVNVATATATTPGGVLTRTDDAPVNLQDPKLTLVKQLVSADLDDVAPNYVTFTIAITNVGVSVVDVLPMLDQYDTYYLSFVWADVMPDEPADDGILTWYDLTAPPPHGFDRNLAPGEGFHVTTVFSVAHDITSTVNTAVITDATDVYRNPTNRPTDTVPINNTPTAVELLYFRVDRVSGQQVRFAWATAVEIDNLGFNLYRANVNDPSRASLIHFEPAVVMGGRLGATYVYTDTVPSDGVWWYWLADVDTGGVETRSMQAGVRAEVNAALRYRVYLPVVFKRP